MRGLTPSFLRLYDFITDQSLSQLFCFGSIQGVHESHLLRVNAPDSLDDAIAAPTAK